MGNWKVVVDVIFSYCSDNGYEWDQLSGRFIIPMDDHENIYEIGILFSIFIKI